MNIHNRKYLKQTRKNLRNNLTSAEAALWTYLQNKKLSGRKFRRQHSIGNYIVDFYCPKEKLIIELDGEDHFSSAGYERDQARDEYLKSLDLNVIHIENQEVFINIDEVLCQISSKFTSPAPPKIGGESDTEPPAFQIRKKFNIPNGVLVFLLAGLFFFSSCEDWLDVNKDPNNPDEANEQLALSSGISSVAYVYGGKYQVLGALWSQHWTQSLGASQYSGLDSYDINSSTFDNRQYGELYTGALKNLEYVRRLAYDKQNWGYYLIATVMQCYTFQLLADLYDEIPFSEALKGEGNITNPHFEKGQDIYDSLIARLDFALSLDFEAETSEDIGSEDLLFEGNIERWKQFASTLKLKIYLRQVYQNPEIAKNGIENLYQNPEVKFLTTDASMTQFVNETGRANPLYETEIRFLNNPNLILSYTLYSYLSDKGDLERLDAMFDFPETGGGHKSLIQGNYNDPDEPTGTNSSDYSKPVFIPTTPVYLMSASEAYFLQAEAIIRFETKSYSTAKEFYQKGIEASFLRLLYPYGYSESQISDIAEDLYGPGDPYAFPVEGSPVEEFVKAIITQKWVSLAGIQSLETFFEHNRTHYPRESPVPASDEGNYVPGEFTISVNNVTSGRFPKRLIFPESEYSANINTPAKKEVYEKIWWDVKMD